MAVSLSVAPRRQRAGRGADTLDRLRRAACDELVTVGWDGLSLRRVALGAGMSTRPLYDRFDDLSHVGADLWEAVVAPHLCDAVVSVLDSGMDASRPAEDRARLLADALEGLARPGSELVAAAELLLAARFDDVLRQAVVGGPWKDVAARCSSAGTPTESTQVAFLVIVALGFLLAHRNVGASTVDPYDDLLDLMTAYDAPAEPLDLPSVHVPGHKVIKVSDPDPMVQALYTATLAEVSERGYAAATLTRIVGRSGASQGLIHSRFGTKLDLFIEATQRQHAEGFRENQAFAERLVDRFGAGGSEAIMIREFSDPANEKGYSLTFEQLRLRWHDDRMREVQDAVERDFVQGSASGLPGRHVTRASDHMHWNIALGLGAHLASGLIPDIHLLPFEVVMVPLVAAQLVT